MAFTFKNFCRAIKGNNFIKTLIHQRSLTARPQLTSLTKSTKRSFIQWNSPLSLTNGTLQCFWNARFHHLAEHTMISNAVYLMNVRIRNFARTTKEVPSRLNFKHIKEVYKNVRFEKEKLRLKRKGVMKDITAKLPEGVVFSKL